jgi:NAD(P)-dependent dehydrogenase (short-subunit alcohol dehydrogenase family)
MQMDGVEGRVALITGGGRGIGRSVAEMFCAQRAKVAVGDLEAPAIEGALGVELDVTSSDSVDAAFRRVEEELGAVELLIINAGIFVVGPFDEITAETWDRVLKVNTTGSFFCAQRALGPMRSAGFGRIVSIGSSAGKTPGKNPSAAYNASKAGMMMLTKSIASEYARFGITANVIAPSFIRTEMIADLPDVTERIPLGRLGTPEEVAGMTVFLCSAQAAFITGEVVDINGGIFID